MIAYIDVGRNLGGVMYPDEEESENDKLPLPDGVTEEKIDSLVGELMKTLERLGVYPLVGTPPVYDGEELYFMATFEIGDLAFVNRVQNPEQDEFDKKFGQFETDALRDRVEEIKKKFSGETDQP